MPTRSGAARRNRQRRRLTAVVLMVVAVGAVAVFGITTIWSLFTRRPQAATTSHTKRANPSSGQLESERDAAWWDSHGWQVENERDRVAWEEAPDD